MDAIVLTTQGCCAGCVLSFFQLHMKSMLIVDTPTLAKLSGDLFEKLGWTITVCSNRTGAMSRVAGSEPYNIILLGHVSGIDGLQLTRFIRSLEHRMTTGVIMITGNAEITDEATAAGVDEVLFYPVKVSSLLMAVNKMG